MKVVLELTLRSKIEYTPDLGSGIVSASLAEGKLMHLLGLNLVEKTSRLNQCPAFSEVKLVL